VLGLLAGSASPALAKVASIRLEQMVSRSDLVVVARVVSVSQARADGPRVAKAKVLETWKGATGAAVEYRASPTWACDISEAFEGETVVLFLVKSKGAKLLSIAHAGRGRMPLREVKGREYAAFWCGEVRLPPATETITLPDQTLKWVRHVERRDLRDLVRR
jgi:hypothetical protein